MAVLATRNGFRYAFTADDVLWAARMIDGEGGDPAAVLWTMGQRFAKVRSSMTFGEFVQRYSQPIHPDWSPCTERNRERDPAACTPEREASRARRRSKTPAELGASYQLANAWAAGRVPNPVPRAVHFANGPVSQNCLEHRDCTNVIARFPADRPPERQNWHMSDATSDRWPENFVTINGMGASASSSGGGYEALFGVALLVGAAAVAYGVAKVLR